MVKISKVTWISKEALEAEVIITDGKFELLCFSQPFNHVLDGMLSEPLHCYNAKNIVKADGDDFKALKLTEYFAYNITGKLISRQEGILILGDIQISVDKDMIPRDIQDGIFIAFYCQRIDLF